MSPDVNSCSATTRPVFRPHEQRVVMSLVLTCVLVMGWYAVMQCGLPMHSVDIERSRSVPAAYRMPLNSATWHELAQMPGVAETLARRIVSHRERHGPFASPGELVQVHGIGPRLSQGMRPYLLPMEPICVESE